MRPAKTAKEVLIAARWMLENIGWTQRKFFDLETRCMCASGALNRVECNDGHGFDSAIREEARNKLVSVIRNDIITWNDNQFRTKEHVLAAFDAAIKACDG